MALAPPAHGKLVKGSKNSATEKQKLSSESSGAGQVVGGSGEASVSAARIQEQGYPSSVVYNMSIAEDLSVLLHHRLLKNTFETFAVAKSATLLLKVMQYPIAIYLDYYQNVRYYRYTVFYLKPITAITL